MRGISEIGAVILVSEIGDFYRFAHPRQFVSYLGLSPSEHSSGNTIIRGGITKAGSAHARRVLIEGARSYRLPARVGKGIASWYEGLEGGSRHRLEGTGQAFPTFPDDVRPV
jgi:transposase